MIRTHQAGSLRPEHVGTTVTLAGWVDRRRDLGGVAFLDLRDASGIVQVVVRDDVLATSGAHGLRNEYCIAVTGPDDARRAARHLCALGVGAAVITLGAQGVLYHDAAQTVHIPAYRAGPVVETTGAGDAFNGGFAAALARGDDPVAAVRFGSATAGISVTRPGTAPSMPSLAEIETLLARQPV